MAGSLFAAQPAEPVDTRLQYDIQWDSHMREKTGQCCSLSLIDGLLVSGYRLTLDISFKYSAFGSTSRRHATQVSYSDQTQMNPDFIHSFQINSFI